MFASEKWYNIELAWYEWEGFREALKKEAEEGEQVEFVEHRFVGRQLLAVELAFLLFLFRLAEFFNLGGMYVFAFVEDVARFLE